MLRDSLISLEEVSLLPKDKRHCTWISNWFILQCVIVYIGSATIIFCVWSPEHSVYDYDKLFRIMYLYDPHACGYNLRSSKSINNLKFNDETFGLNILPIEWMPASVTVSTKLSTKTRMYIKLSAFVHLLWMLTAILLRILKLITKWRLQKLLITITFYSSIFVIFFDMSMAIVYIAHIQQSLTKGMILRYSGWSVDIKINKYYDFGGWLPIAACTCWLRGGIILAVNIYCCRILQLIRRKIKRREVKERLVLRDNGPIPEPNYMEPNDDKVLYFRAGEHKPYTRRSYNAMFFY